MFVWKMKGGADDDEDRSWTLMADVRGGVRGGEGAEMFGVAAWRGRIGGYGGDGEVERIRHGFIYRKWG